jgi:hypothetical protein
MKNRLESAAAELLQGRIRVDAGKSKLIQTRTEVERGWRAVSEILVREEQPELASQVERFVKQMPPPLTEKEQLANAVLAARKARTLDQFPPAR